MYMYTSGRGDDGDGAGVGMMEVLLLLPFKVVGLKRKCYVPRLCDLVCRTRRVYAVTVRKKKTHRTTHYPLLDDTEYNRNTAVLTRYQEIKTVLETKAGKNMISERATRRNFRAALHQVLIAIWYMSTARQN